MTEATQPSEGMTRADFEARIVAWAQEDENFKQELLSNPKALFNSLLALCADELVGRNAADLLHTSADQQALQNVLAKNGYVHHYELPVKRAEGLQTTSRPFLTSVFHFIETNYRNPIGLREVAQAVGYSSAYLTNLVQQKTGRTVNQWIAEYRMAEARLLLLKTNQSVNQIAAAVGYQGTEHFIRMFRQFHGMTPKAWRNEHRS